MEISISASASTNTAALTIGTVSAYFMVLSETPVVAPSPYFPLAVGNSWVTSRNGSVGLASTIGDTQLINDVVTLGVPETFDGSIAYFSNDGLLGVRLHRIYSPASEIPGCGTVPATDTYNSPLTLIPANVTLGQAVPSSGAILADLGPCGRVTIGYNATSSIESVERVSVPAGQFDALKVRLTVSVAGLSDSATYWFARDVGQVKALNSDGTVDELVSTNVVRTAPDELAFAAQSNVPLNAVVISNPVTISGITAAAAISISGGEYSIDGGTFTNQPGSVTNGRSVRISLTSSAQGSTNTSAILTVGGVVGRFSVTTGVGAPGAPTAVTVTSGISLVTVSFTAPASNGGAAITGYTATCTSPNGGATGSNTSGASATFIHISGLTNGKSYTCTVTASNALGVGAASAPSIATFPFDIAPILNLLLD